MTLISLFAQRIKITFIGFTGTGHLLTWFSTQSVGIRLYTLQRGKTPPPKKKKCPGYDTKLYLMERLLFWRPGDGVEYFLIIITFRFIWTQRGSTYYGPIYIGKPRSAVAKVLDCEVGECDFELQFIDYVYFRTNIFGKSMNSLYPSTMG